MIGTYYRLSLADEDVGADKAESNSIQGQRGLVEGYIMARPELATEPRQEYVDDGYSGTSTSRPAFQRLIQDAQDGKVKTIIVKDFSRFARDYIEAGDYMERIFPLLGVRFISVNDGYDSGMQAGNDVRGLEVAIKNIINASYSRDVLEILHERERKALICFSALERQEEKLSAEKAEIVKQRVALYEQYADGNMSKEEFIRQRDAYRVQEDEKISAFCRGKIGSLLRLLRAPLNIPCPLRFQTGC